MKLSIKTLTAIIGILSASAFASCFRDNPQGVICFSAGVAGSATTIGTCNSGGLSITLYEYLVSANDCLVDGIRETTNNDLIGFSHTQFFTQACDLSFNLVTGNLSNCTIYVQLNVATSTLNCEAERVTGQEDCWQG